MTLEEVLVRGGFPELYAHPEIETSGFYRSYVATYLERDLRQLLQVSQPARLRTIPAGLRLRTAQLLNKAELSRDVGISGSTAGQWLSVLEASGQVALAGTLVFQSHQVAGQDTQAVPGRHGAGCFLDGDPAGGGRGPLALDGRLVGDAWWRRNCGGGRCTATAAGTSTSGATAPRKPISCSTAAARSMLGEAKWTEHPSQRDAEALLRVAAELPRGHVRRCAIICRCANPYPLAADVQAISLDELDELPGESSGQVWNCNPEGHGNMAMLAQIDLAASTARCGPRNPARSDPRRQPHVRSSPSVLP